MTPESNCKTTVQSYRNPAQLAKMAASLGWLAPGRFVFGIGAGWNAAEAQAYGYPFPPITVRMQQLDEALTIVRRLWTEEVVTFAGQHYRVHEASLAPKPNPRPPILIGTAGEQLGLRLVAKHADWWHLPDGTRAEYQHKLDVLREHCAAIGSEFDRIVRSWGSVCTALAATTAEAQQIAAQSPYGDPENSRLVGTPDVVAEEIQAWIDLGISQFQLQFADFPRLDSLKLFVTEVLPRFRRP
jgi:alkanesulfonate monooxygenase SsuD/methylene tetrahydromethanopterin reductase-like flavin-dependent oxidoreductase (luciferase family)